MKIGTLWLDASDSSLREKVLEAARRYEEKFDKPPNVCYIHPSEYELPEGAKTLKVDDIEILPRKTILKYHYFVGVKTDGES